MRLNKHTLIVQVLPNAPSNALLGWSGEKLKVRIQAPLEDRLMNPRLERFLAAYLEIPLPQVEVVDGFGKRTRTVEISGLSAERIARRLDKPDLVAS